MRVTYTFKRRTAIVRSEGVKNHASVGESGKKNLVPSEDSKLQKFEIYLPIDNCSYQGQDASDDHKPKSDISEVILSYMMYAAPSPWLKAWCIDVQSAETDKPSYNLRCGPDVKPDRDKAKSRIPVPLIVTTSVIS